MPHPESAVWGGLPFASSEFRDFRAHGPRTRIDDPSAHWEIDRSCNCRRHHRRSPSRPWRRFSAADTDLIPASAVLSVGSTSSAEAPAATTSVTRHAPSSSSTSQGADSTAITDPAASTPSPHYDPAPGHIRATSPIGRAKEQPPTLAPSHLLLIMASVPAGFLVRLLDVRIPRLWPSLRPPLLPPRMTRRYSSCPAATTPNLWELLH